MSVLDEARKYMEENSWAQFTDYYINRLKEHVHATTGVRITKEESAFLLKQLIKEKEVEKK